MSSQVKHNRYQHQIVEPKWQAQWKKSGIDVADLDNSKPPFYNLMMFPYPSAEGLHVGNMYAFVGTDIFGRYKRMQGYNVFEPIGLDGFGIHSENYALKVGKHPIEQAKRSQENFYRQLSVTGCMFDWTRTVETYDPTYYAWTQWLFVQMFRNGLAYRGKADVNWCPSCKTVLADEQVIDGKCERCGNLVEKRLLEQWFFRITAYAGKLLENISSLKWSQKVLIAQKNWIGKKEGINITYDVYDETQKSIVSRVICFTTTPVNFGATFLVLAPEHALVTHIIEVIKNKQSVALAQYVIATKKKTPQDRLTEGKTKTGVFSGLYAKNHVTGEMIPVWVSDFVLGNVGTGAIQACPGHDVRDFAFAMQYQLPITRVVVGADGDISEITKESQVVEHGPGVMIHSDFLDGIEFSEAMEKTKDYFEQKGWGKRVTTYHLRDWLISRQRYWGPPIPMIYCDTCAKANQGERKDMAGWYTVKDESLPVLLPNIADYKPGDDGVAPLAKHKEFYETTCPSCGSVANRETDVSDTFLDSSWYFLRYPSVGSSTAKTAPFDPAITKKWLPVSMYTGGAEHSVLHLMYSRFVTMALKDWGFINFEEPFPNFFAHGLVIKDGAKMSKSKGNVINPDEYIKLYGTDALRLYLMFMGPFAEGGDFRDASMEGMARWVGRVWRISIASLQLSSDAVDSDIVTKSLHKMLKKVGDDTEMRHYNTAIASMMEFTNVVNEATGTLSHKALRMLLIVLAPYAPHLTEEIWSMLGGTDSVHAQLWPTYDSEQIKDDQIPFVIQVNGKTRGTITVDVNVGHDQAAVEALVRKNENIARHLSGKEVRKVIFVPSKIINFVVS